MFARTLAFASFFAVACLAAGCANSTDDETISNEGSATTDRARDGGKFEKFVGEDNEKHFRLLAKNGLKLIRSEAYKAEADANATIQSLLTGAKNDADNRFQVLESSVKGQFYVNVIGAGTSKEVIATSELYSSKSKAESAKKVILGYLKGIADTTLRDADTSGERFDIFQLDADDAPAGQPFKFILRAKNGEAVLASEFYSSKQAAQEGIKAVRDYGRLIGNYKVVKVGTSRGTFALKADTHFGSGTQGNHETIGFGEHYATEAGAAEGADKVRDMLQHESQIGVNDTSL